MSSEDIKLANQGFSSAGPPGSELVNAEYLDRQLGSVNLQRDRASWERPGLSLSTFLSLIYRWRWLFLAIVLLTTTASALRAVLQTPLYRAAATLDLNPAPARVVQTTDAQEPRQQADEDFLALQIGLVKSRSLAERVARSLNLGRDPVFLGHSPSRGARPEDAVSRLMSNFSASGTPSDRIMQIAFVHPDPAMAARVVNGFAEEAVDSTFERSYAATARSRAFLQRRLEATRQELERSERQLIEYARRANIVNVVRDGAAESADGAGGTLVASNLIALNQQLADAQNARIVAQQRYNQATASVNEAVEEDATVQALRHQRAQLQAEYEQKLERFRPEYPEMVSINARIDALDHQITSAVRRAESTVTGSLRANLVASQNREQQLQTRIGELEARLLDLNDRGVQYTILRRAVDANRSLYNALLARLGEENSSATRSSSVALVDVAQAPNAPFHPNIPRALILGFLGGIVLGSIGAVGAERWHDTINLPEDVVDHLGIPVLGVIPLAPANENLDDLLADPRSSVAEAYHSTRASLQFLTARGVPRSILFSSSKAGEGKTSSAIAIAADFISVSKRVVVIDADLRNPSIMGPDSSKGLSAFLAGDCELNEVMTETDTRGLFLIPAGPIPSDPTVLLASRAMQELVGRLERQFDAVIIDGPPVMGLADAPLLSAVIEATVLVIASGQTRRGVAVNAIERLQSSGGTVVGAILNKFSHKEHVYGYGYGTYAYNYNYGSSSNKRALIGPARQIPDQHC